MTANAFRAGGSRGKSFQAVSAKDMMAISATRYSRKILMHIGVMIVSSDTGAHIKKKLAKISRQKLETIRKKNSDKEDTCIAIPPPDTPGDRIKRLVDEIVGYETEIDKKKEEIVELLH